MAYEWNPFGVTNVAASALLLVLGLLLLKARRSEFAIAFAAYSILAAGQKFCGGVALYFSADEATRGPWLLASSLFLLASTPTLAHALAAFTWGPRVERIPRSRKALLYLPFALLAPVVLTDPGAFQALSLPFAFVFVALLALFLVPVAGRAFAGRAPAVRRQNRYMLAYLVIALSFSIEARVVLFLYGRFPWWELSMAYLVATGILVYGVLRAHLFDVDLKVKWTVRQSTVAAVFIGVFFMVSEAAQQFFATDANLGPYLGIAAAGLLVFAMAPLQRAAERVADVALPGVHATHEYMAFRKLEVYKTALELAAEDGVITPRERQALRSLRRTLGIGGADAEAMEAEVRRRRVST